MIAAARDLCRTARLGPHLVHMRWQPEVASGEAVGWCEPLAQDATLTVDVTVGQVAGTEHIHFGQFESHCAHFTAKSVSGSLDWAKQTGHWRAARPVDLDHRRGQLDQALFATFHALVLRSGGLMVHGANLMFSDRAYLVVGPSGAGKSTLAGRFPGRYGHDDTSFVVAGQPWQVWGQRAVRAPQTDVPWALPLAAIFFLGPDRSASAVHALAPSVALPLLAGQTYFAGGAAMDRLACNLEQLVTSTPVFALSHSLATPADELAQLLVCAVDHG